jgi:hypothetical protein
MFGPPRVALARAAGAGDEARGSIDLRVGRARSAYDPLTTFLAPSFNPETFPLRKLFGE